MNHVLVPTIHPCVPTLLVRIVTLDCADVRFGSIADARAQNHPKLQEHECLMLPGSKTGRKAIHLSTERKQRATLS
jgi:hypothetical protein